MIRLKKILSMLLCLTLCLAAAPAVVLADERPANLIVNGDFATGDTTGWTNRKGGEIKGHTIYYDEYLGMNVLSITAEGRESDNCIGTAWTVEPGKMYYLGFWVKGKYPFSYNHNYEWQRVADARAHTESETAWDIPYNANTLISYGRDIKGNGWQHMERIFTAKTDTVYFQCGWSNGPVDFTGFVLSEIKPSFSTDVTVRYLDKDTGLPLKEPRVAVGVQGYESYAGTPGINVPGADDLVFRADESDKQVINVDGARYVYDALSSEDKLIPRNDGENVLDLYFERLSLKESRVLTLDLTYDQELSLPDVVLITYENDTSAKTGVVWDDPPELAPGMTAEVSGVTDGGYEVTALLKRFYPAPRTDLPDDYDSYDWVGIGDKKYAAVKGSQNIITNGDFATGDTYGWTNRRGDGEDRTLASSGTNSGFVEVYYDEELGMNALSIKAGGRNDSNSIGTVWTVEPGKNYYLGFYVSGQQPTYSSEQYQRVADARAHTESETAWDVAPDANILLPYGKLMDDKEGWQPMEAVFTAETDMVYFECSWSDNPLKFADFQLYEIELPSYSFDKYSHLVINVDGEDADELYLGKGQPVPKEIPGHPGTVAVNNVDTDNPEGGTIYVLTDGSNSCGENVFWSFDESANALTVSGTGPMYDFMYNAPWNGLPVTSAVIDNGVTYLGSNSFTGLELSSLSLPDSLQSAGRNIFGPISSGNSCGNGVRWEYHEKSGVLVLGGDGPTYDYEGDGFKEFQNLSPSTVIIEQNVTTVGDRLFKYCSNIGKVLLPDTLTSIGVAAFNFTGIRYIVLPDSVMSIGNYAFQDCENLFTVDLGAGVRDVGITAFGHCNELTSVKFSDALETLDYSAFMDCQNLKEIVIDAGNPNFSTVDGVLYNKDMSAVFLFPSAHDSEYNIPDTLKTFNNVPVYDLTALNVSDTNPLYSSLDGVLYSKDGQTLLLYPGMRPDSSYEVQTGTTVIDGGFTGSALLTSLTLPASLTTVEANALSGCTALTDVYWYGSQEAWESLNAALVSNALIHYNVGLSTRLDYIRTTISYDSITVETEAVNMPDGAYVIAAAFTVDRKLAAAAVVTDGKAVLPRKGVNVIKLFAWDGLGSVLPVAPMLTKRFDSYGWLYKAEFADLTATQELEKENPIRAAADGDLNTYWACDHVGSITADLGDIKEIYKILIYFRHYDDARVLPVTVDISEDGETWKQISLAFIGGEQDFTLNIDEKYIARYVRISLTGSNANGWSSLAEIEVYI